MLAEKTSSFQHLVQIKIENRRDYMGAIKIIDQRIPDLKEKVKILQRYAPKLLATKSAGALGPAGDAAEAGVDSHLDVKKSVKKIVKDIAKALCEFSKNRQRGFDTKEFNQKFMVKAGEKVLVEDLLQIFVDDLDYSLDLVGYVVNDLARHRNFEKEIDKISNINLYHRYLEYKHYKKRMDDLSQPQVDK